MRSILSTRAVRLFAAAALVAGAAACDRSPTGEDHAEAAAVRLTVGNQVVTVTAAGAQTGTLTLPQGTHTVAVAFLDAGMDPITDFEDGLSLQVVPVSGTTGVSFTASGLTGGTLTASTPGQKTVSVRLMHGDHPDFAQNVVFTVQ